MVNLIYFGINKPIFLSLVRLLFQMILHLFQQPIKDLILVNYIKIIENYD